MIGGCAAFLDEEKRRSIPNLQPDSTQQAFSTLEHLPYV